MSSEPPKLIALDPDDYSAKYVGHTQDGKQFFLTFPFVPGGHDFLALYLFDAEGDLLEARIDDLGLRDSVDEVAARRLREQRVAELGRTRRRRINVKPFGVERFGTVFGFIACAPEEGREVWCVEAQPGNFMAFFEPFDCGGYDT